MHPIDVILKRAEAEIAAGRAWRAKEILRGALASRADAALLERYGRLLDSMGDRYEAGKCLFLSGVRLPDYAEAIDVFLTRNAGRSDADLVQQFPSAVRRTAFGDLSPVVQEALRQRGVREGCFGARPPVPSPPSSLSDRTTMLFGILIGLLFFLALGLGVARIIRWVISL